MTITINHHIQTRSLFSRETDDFDVSLPVPGELILVGLVKPKENPVVQPLELAMYIPCSRPEFSFLIPLSRYHEDWSDQSETERAEIPLLSEICIRVEDFGEGIPFETASGYIDQESKHKPIIDREELRNAYQHSIAVAPGHRLPPWPVLEQCLAECDPAIREHHFIGNSLFREGGVSVLLRSFELAALLEEFNERDNSRSH